jgi:hypothetical protein
MTEEGFCMSFLRFEKEGKIGYSPSKSPRSFGVVRKSSMGIFVQEMLIFWDFGMQRCPLWGGIEGGMTSFGRFPGELT